MVKNYAGAVDNNYIFFSFENNSSFFFLPGKGGAKIFFFHFFDPKFTFCPFKEISDKKKLAPPTTKWLKKALRKMTIYGQKKGCKTGYKIEVVKKIWLEDNFFFRFFF